MAEPLSPTELRVHLYRVLDEVLATGRPQEIVRQGRRLADPDILLGQLAIERGVLMTDDSALDVVGRAMELTWTRDPFDRLLVATALLHDAPLITRDRRIHENFAGASW